MIAKIKYEKDGRGAWFAFPNVRLIQSNGETLFVWHSGSALSALRLQYVREICPEANPA